ncbi:MAG: hypothetical protein AAGF88_08400 [Pseudomonadota bacterium]
MSEDRVDLDTIIALESRINAALDRISGAVAVQVVVAANPEPDPALVAAEARIEALSADLAAAQAAAEDQAGLAAEIERLTAELGGDQAAGGEAEELALLRERADRLRAERNAIREERDALAEELDSYRSGSAAPAEQAVSEMPELVSALRDLRTANAELSRQSEAMRHAAAAGDGAPPPDTLNAAMAAELLSLRAERAADAAEMQLILDELRPLTEGTQDA